MERKQKEAIVLGATGLVGGIVLDLLLKDDRYKKVTVFSRRALETTHPKLNTIIGNLLQLDTFASGFHGDEVFCCIGTTKAKTPNKDTYRKIDFGIPSTAAKLCKQNGIGTFIVVSAMGADSGSPIFYNRIKGEMEEAVLAVGLEKTHSVQPALIGGTRDEKRPGEYFFKKLMNTLDFLMIGPFRQYKIILPETIAKAMIWLANNPYDKKRVPSETLKELVAHGTS